MNIHGGHLSTKTLSQPNPDTNNPTGDHQIGAADGRPSAAHSKIIVRTHSIRWPAYKTF
ncbi:MAG: hypothetical protein H6633_18935 [Anaerolineales bacterium]|nr:hypothetical protein [Anaerolineales bacterium]